MDLLIDDAGPRVLHNRDLQAFGVDIRRNAAKRSADIWPVGHAARKPNKLPVVKNRRSKRQMVEMTSSRISVVRQ